MESFQLSRLRERLVLRHRFQTKSDTEGFVHGWEEWAKTCLTIARMFAFALLICANISPRASRFPGRDPLGIKPLYYSNR